MAKIRERRTVLGLMAQAAPLRPEHLAMLGALAALIRLRNDVINSTHPLKAFAAFDRRLGEELKRHLNDIDIDYIVTGCEPRTPTLAAVPLMEGA